MELKKIAEMLAEISDTPAEEITEETTFEELSVDSLDLTELAMNVEDEYGIILEMEQSIRTVGDFLARVNAQIG